MHAERNWRSFLSAADKQERRKGKEGIRRTGRKDLYVQYIKEKSDVRNYRDVTLMDVANLINECG